MNLREQLESKGKRELRIILKAMREGKIGFDTEKFGKAHIIDVIITDSEGYSGKAEILQQYLDDSSGNEEIKEEIKKEERKIIPPKKSKQSGSFDLEGYIKDVAGDAINEERVIELIESHHKAPRPVIVVKNGDEKLKEIKTDGKHPVFAECFEYLNAGENVMLVGPSGCGKSYLARQLADALGVDFDMLSGSAGVQEYHFTGRMLPTGENGRFQHELAPFAHQWKKGKNLFLIDEADALDENVFLKINGALADGLLKIDETRENIQRAKDQYLVATANTLGAGSDMQYTGRNALDKATRERFVYVCMDYDTDLETHLFDSDVISWGHTIREKIRSKGINQILSTRTLARAQNFKAHGMPKTKWDKAYYGHWSKDERRQMKGA